ncbi:MAG: right-handed parallel beta-helix repeat-containing protein [Planctomycetota bacterium]
MRHKFRDADGSTDGQTVRHRLADPVYRRQNIVLKEESARPATSGGAPLNFVHVVPGEADVADNGTFENPYRTISTAMNPLSPPGIVYTPYGGTFDGPVTMLKGSRLFSNGPTQFVSTNVGSVQLPFSGANSSLTALPSKIMGDVTLADNTVLNGFDVQRGIFGTNLTDVSLINNRIASSQGDAIRLESSSDVSMNNLLIENPVGRGIVLTDSSASLSLVTIQNSGDTAVELNRSVGARMNNLLIADSAGRGIQLNDSSANLSTVTIQNSGNTAIEINTTDLGGIVAASGLTITNTEGSIRGIDANVNGAGSLLLGISAIPGAAIAPNSISVQRDAVNISTRADSTGNAVVLLNALNVSSTNGAGIVVNGSAGSGTMFVSGFAGNSVTKADNRGVLFDTVTFDSDPLTPEIEPVSAGILSVGAVPDDVKGAGVSIQNSTGDLDLGVARIFNNNGPGLFVTNSPNLTVRSTTLSSMETQTGPVLDLGNTKTALKFTSLKSKNSSSLEHGIHLNNVTGTITSTTTNIVASDAPAAILIENIPVAPDSLKPNFGALTIESLFNNTEANNISLPGVTTGIVQPIYTELTIVGP